jgi:hypothetical protein
VTRWAQGGQGKKFLNGNHGDINIGDLATEGISDVLTGELRKEGVENLTIECHVGDRASWDYDDNLYVEEE